MEQREEKNARVQSEVTDKTLSFELNGELLLPDYLGEVSRLLRVRPTVLPPERFISGGNAEFSGRVCYDILYAGADGKLYSTEMEDTYSFSVPTEATGGDALCARVVPDVVVGRVAAPRKLTTRCRMHAHISGYAEAEIGATLPAEAEERVCRLGEMAECGRFSATVGEPVEVYDDFDLEGVSPAVISARGEVFLPDVSTMAGAVRCRGEVIVTLLCVHSVGAETEVDESESAAALADTAPFAVVRRLPFESEVPFEGVGADYAARATATVSEVRAAVENGRASVAARVIPQIEAVCREPVCYTKDLFMPYMQTECRSTVQKAWVPQVCGNKNYSISGSFQASEVGIPANAVIVDACADAEVTEKGRDGKSIVLSGEVHCHLLYRQGTEWGTGEATLPFRVMCEGSFEVLSVLATAPLCRVQQDKERLRVDAELLLSLSATSTVTLISVGEAKFLPPEAATSADLEFYYPTEGETLWEVCRRYALPPSDVAMANGVSGDDLSDPAALDGVRYLMMPTRAKIYK